MPENLQKHFQEDTLMLGELENTYQIGIGENLFLVIVTLFVAIFGILIFVANKDITAFFICTIPLALPLFIICWNFFQTKNDELKIYQNGFTYQSRKGLQICLWKQIKYIEKNRFGQLNGVRKKNDKIISVDISSKGKNKLTEKLKTLGLW
jgi:hypothetical protein